MKREPAEAATLAGAFSELEPVLLATALPDALAAVAAVVAARTGSPASALYLFEGGEAVGEAWYPREGQKDPALLASFRLAAERALGPLARARTTSQGVEPGEPSPARKSATESSSAKLPQVVVFPVGPRASGVACFQDEGKRRDSRDLRELATLLRLVGLHLHALQTAGSEVTTRTQYERWFRTLDDQVRVLDRERQKFAAVVQQSDACVFVVDTSRSICWTNEAMREKCAQQGGTPVTPGLDCRAVCSRLGEDAERGCLDCPLQRSLEENRIVHREFRGGAAGEVSHHYLTALPIRGTDGRPHEVMVTIQDLSDLEVLRESEARYRLLFERSSRAILLVDTQSQSILQANPMAELLTGRSSAQLVSLRLRDLCDPAEWDRMSGHFEKGFEGQTLKPREIRLRALGGSERITMMAGTRYEIGPQNLVMLDFQDVTERRRVEQALRKAEMGLRTVVSHLPIVLFSVDSNGFFTMSEGRGLQSLGLQSGEVVGRSIFDVYEGQPKILDDVRRALAGEEFTSSVEVAGVAFETRYSPLRDDHGAPAGAIGVATDITDRRRLEDELQQAQKMEAIGRLAGGVAHDFNNLLSAILGHCELLMRRLPEEGPLRGSAEEIHKAGARGALLTRQLLAFSRRDVPEMRALEVRAVVGEMEGMLRRLIGEDVELAAAVGSEPTVVRGDRTQIEQVVLNLIVNARDALPEGGRIDLEVRAADLDDEYARTHSGVVPGAYVMIGVTDNGCGMSPETLAHVFEPFYSTKERGRGTGLGLSTVYGIVQRNGGSISVASEPDRGSSFKVFLPRVAEVLPAAPDSSGADAPMGDETVLLVEDEDPVRDLVREALELHGYHVIAASGGEQGLKFATGHRGPIHLLLTDVVMPRMGGAELARRLAEFRPDTRVLFMSGYTDDAVVRHGVLEARVAFLQKPFALETLARRVRDVLDAPLDHSRRAGIGNAA